MNAFTSSLIRQIVSDRACRWGSWTLNGVVNALIDQHGIEDEQARADVAVWANSVDAMDFSGTCLTSLYRRA
jgi:hypothetical protein